ncbi:MAG: 30S ribosomal protein S20 [Cyanobacteriota/Melainabacteria group bacterium]
MKAGDLSTCDEQVKTYYEVIDKAINKGVLHKNAGARKKARLVKRINKQKAES